METKRRSTLIYGILFGAWLLVVFWQIDEHSRVQESARRALRARSSEIGNTLSAVMRALRFRGTVLQQRLEPVLDELVNGRTNQLVNPSGIIAIELINTAGEPIAAAGDTNAIQNLTEREIWSEGRVTFVNTIEGATVNPEGTTNATVVLPSPPSDFTNGMRGGFPMPQAGQNDTNPPGFGGNFNGGPPPDFGGEMRGRGPMPPPDQFDMNSSNAAQSMSNGAPPDFGNRPRGGGGGGRGRPPWMRGLSDEDFKALIARRELHGLALTMSTENYDAICTHDIWMRFIIVLFAGISAAGTGLSWRNTSKNSELQIRLVRASELNSHLKELNLAAAGLAHETRNPLNIIRGMAQMLSKESSAPVEIKDKARAIVDETDKVTLQLNEFINYSRPREVRRTRLVLNSAIAEVMRALNNDIEEKKIRVETKGDVISIEADEQMLRQVLFNLLLNAIQAVGSQGEIQIITAKQTATEAILEIRDNGSGVPPERRREIFKPYFTTHQKGTGLGLAVVQQIVLAHGWEIECLPNTPNGAVFRITHLKLAS